MVQKFITIILYFYFTVCAFSFESAALNAELLKCLGSFESIKELSLKNNSLNNIDKLINKAYDKAIYVGFLEPFAEDYYFLGKKNIAYIYENANHEMIMAIFSGCKETLKLIHD